MANGERRAKIKKQLTSKENIWNIPNTLTFIRVVLTFVLFYLIFAQYSLVVIAIIFAIGMITDFLDGQIARRFDMATEFGRKFDIIADRFLLIGTVIALVMDFSLQGALTRGNLLLIFFVMSREIISFPFALILFASRKPIPHARFIGKLTTFFQGFAIPVILLSINYPFFSFAPHLAIITGIIGIFSAFAFINDTVKEGVNEK